MQQLQLGDYRGGRDTLQTAMQMQYSPLEHIQSMASAIAQQGVSNMGAMNRQREQEKFETGKLKESENFTRAMEQMKFDQAQKLNEQKTELENKKESDLHKRQLQESGEQLTGYADSISTLYDAIGAGLDPNSELGKSFSDFNKSVKKGLYEGTVAQRSGFVKRIGESGLGDPTNIITALQYAANAKRARTIGEELNKSKPDSNVAPITKPKYGLSIDSEYHFKR